MGNQVNHVSAPSPPDAYDEVFKVRFIFFLKKLVFWVSHIAAKKLDQETKEADVHAD